MKHRFEKYNQINTKLVFDSIVICIIFSHLFIVIAVMIVPIANVRNNLCYK